MEKRIPCTNYACEARGPTQRDGHCCSGTIVYDKASRPRQRFYAELKGSTTERGDCQVG